MFRSKAFRNYSLEQFLSALFPRNNPKLLYKNSSQYIIKATYSIKAKESLLTSNTHHDRGPEINEKLRKLTDKEFLVRLKTDPDSFGSQSEPEILDEGDIEEEKYFTHQPLPSQKLRTKKYADIIKALIRKRKIKEAIDVLEIRMLKQDRVKPEAYIYNLILGACGRVGYTKKAFMLYNDMKRRGLQVMGATYTALFNACSNSPWPLTDGLSRAKHLREIMIEKGHEPNEIIYNAMIKTFGRCGDISTAFSIVDEIVSKGHPVTKEMITFLLQACITDKETGFRHALLVWRKVVDRKIKPDIYTYNMFLRSIRDCDLGDIVTTKDVVNKILLSKEKKLLLLDTEDTFLTVSNTCNTQMLPKNISDQNEISNESSALIDGEITVNCNVNKELEQNELFSTSGSERTDMESESKNYFDNLRPNLMATIPHLGSLIALSEVTKPEDRLLLVGGFKGFLENMNEHECTPNIKTFTLLLDCMPGSLAAEQELLALLKKHDVKPDIDFYNILMKKRSLRSDYEGAKVRFPTSVLYSMKCWYKVIVP